MRWCCGGSSLICGNDQSSSGSARQSHTPSRRSSSTPVTLVTNAVFGNQTSSNIPGTVTFITTTDSGAVFDKNSSNIPSSNNSFDYSPTSTLLPVSPSNCSQKNTKQKKSSPFSATLLSFSKGTKLPPLQEMPTTSETYGPMLLKLHKTALLISESPSTSELPLMESLTNAGWTIVYCDPKNLKSLAKDRNHFYPIAILLDSKMSDFQCILESLSSLPYYHDDVFLVALVDRSISDKRKQRLINSQIHHTVVTSSVDISLFDFFACLSSRLQAIPALFAVIEEAEQPIEICDHFNSIQYVNRAYEHLTGLSRDHVLGLQGSTMRRRSLNNTSISRVLPPISTNNTSTPTSLTQPTTPQPLDSENLISSAGAGSAPTLTHQPPLQQRRRSSEWHCIPVPLTNTSYNAQYVYVKRGSADETIFRDMSSSFKSRTSHNGASENSINEALALLREALTKRGDEMKPMIREAVKTLSSQELYTPTLSRMKDSDRITSGYYDGLIRVQPSFNRQRKRSVVDAFQHNKRNSECRRRISTDVRTALENETSWDFDILQLERITDHHALSYLGMKIFDKWKVHENLGCSREVLEKWFRVIESNYHHTNSYHNASHSADVLQATSVFLESESVAEHVLDMHAIAALIAATIHDVDHPGRGNGYLINTRQHLALLYNDQSVLENHHVALAFQLTVQDSSVNIFQNVSREDYTGLRQAIVDMVLATDMSRHFDYLKKFQQTMDNLSDEENRDANSLSICRMMLKVGDISNPLRAFNISQVWANRIVNEYFEQTKEELEKELPLTLALFNRETCNVPMTQVGFIDMFVRDAFTNWCEFANTPELLTILESNYEKWKSQVDTWNTADNVKLSLER